jgi:beta-N-acetylhexosaminidase
MNLLRAYPRVVRWSILLITLGWISAAASSARSAGPEPASTGQSATVASPPSSPWIDSVLASMTLEEKVGQVVMGWAYGHYLSTETDEFNRLTRLVCDQKLGGLIMFQGDVYEEAIMINRLQRLAKVPLLISADLERGLAMRVRRGTYFPDAMAIGATRNPEYAYQVALATAREARALGIHQNYAPVADVNRNPANPVINTRAFGEDPRLVADMVDAYVRGTNAGGVLSTAKHFPGHGDTGVDSHLELPVVTAPVAGVESVDLAPFKDAIASGVRSIMIGHLAVPALDPTPGLPATLSYPITTHLLRDQLGFTGLVVTDAMVMEGVARDHSVAESSVMAFEAGADAILLPGDEAIALNALLTAVRRGEISGDRLEASVRRVLAAKEWLGLNRQKEVDLSTISDIVGSRQHRNLSKEIARAAITVVQNTSRLLPLPHDGSKKTAVVIISDTDNNRTDVNRPGYQYPNEVVGAYFVDEFRRRNPDTEVLRLMPGCNELNFKAARETVEKADLVVLPLYVKVRTSSGSVDIPASLKEFVSAATRLGKATVIVSFGNPYLIGEFPQADVLVSAYSDAEVMVEAAVEALFGESAVGGKLPVTATGRFPFGSGLTLPQVCLRKDDPLVVGADPVRLMKIDSLMMAAIRDSAFPGAQVLVAKDDLVIYDKSFGTYTYDFASREITRATLFDLASMTKVVATTSAVMKLYDEGKLNLDDRVSRYIPQYTQGKKADVTVRHLITHSSGLPPFRKLWEFCRTPEEALDSVYATALVYAPGDSMVYSDLGMIIMGKIIEKITGMRLDQFVKQEFFEPLGMQHTTFNPPKTWRSRIAPTEVDSSWRKGLVWGTVHDENAAFRGGVSGHAGLFSCTSDLAIFMQMLMNGGTYGGRRYIRESTVKEFTRRQGDLSSRALGWDTKSPVGSSAGTLFSASSFGHTGFTGTSVWADPERHLFVIFLTNRVHPTREARGIYKVRPALHDAVIESLVGTGATRHRSQG